MQLSVDRAEFADLVAWAAKAAERRTTLPVLTNLHLEAREDRLIVAATNLEVRHQGEIAAQVDQPGAILAPAAKLAQLAQAAVGERVFLDLIGDRAGDQLRVAFGGGKYRLPTRAAEDFPPAPELKDPKFLRWDGEALDFALDTVGISVSKDDQRFNIACACLETVAASPGVVFFVSTDGKRLTKLERPNSAADSLGASRHLLPLLGVAALRGLLGRKAGEVELLLSARFARLSRDDGRAVTIQLGEGDYLDWRVVVPKNPSIKATARRLDLLAAARRVLIMAGDKYPAVTLDFSLEALVLRSRKVDTGDAEERLAADCNQPLEIIVNLRHVIDALEHMASEEVQVSLTDNENPLMITAQGDPGTLFISMPFPPSNKA